MSAGTMVLAQFAVRRGDLPGLKLHLWITLFGGLTFVGIQAYEFHRLWQFVPLDGNIFGSVFYTLSGIHGIHVLGGVGLIGWVIRGASRGKYGRRGHIGVDLSGMYWYFVVALWVFLFVALYVL